MSERIISLVHGLAHVQPASYCRSPTASRDRLMLLTLAVLADDTGRVEVSMFRLGRLTMLTESPVCAALQSLIGQGLLAGQQEHAQKPKTYQLNVDALTARQGDNVNRDRCELYQLADYGLDQTTIARLEHSSRVGPELATLGTVIELYRSIPEDSRPRRGFAQYLDIRMIGVPAADQIMAAYDAWADDQQSRDS